MAAARATRSWFVSKTSAAPVHRREEILSAHPDVAAGARLADLLASSGALRACTTQRTARGGLGLPRHRRPSRTSECSRAAWWEVRSCSWRSWPLEGRPRLQRDDGVDELERSGGDHARARGDARRRRPVRVPHRLPAPRRRRRRAAPKPSARRARAGTVARDADGDGHRAATCEAPEIAIETGDDCDDASGALYPGGPGGCSERPDGTPIVFPGGSPRGACQTGTRTCNADGRWGRAWRGRARGGDRLHAGRGRRLRRQQLHGVPVRAGRVAAVRREGTGPCKMGRTSCQPDGTYGACEGNVDPGPKDCASAGDDDCNGTPDREEAVCQCPGGMAPGTTRACNTHPGP